MSWLLIPLSRSLSRELTSRRCSFGRSSFDLRSIMATEAATERRPRTAGSSLERVEVRPCATGSTTPLLSATTGSWRPLQPTRGPSLAEIQSEQSARAARAEPPRPITRHPSAPAATTLSSPLARPPPTPTVAPVYTPTRLAPPTTRTPSGSRPTAKGGFGAADVPWTNYTFAPASPPPAHDPFLATSSTPPPPALAASCSSSSSFSAIQSQQKAEVAAIKEVKAPRSFAEVMAREREEARRREEEVRRVEEEVEFARWFEEESRRVQGMVHAPEFVPRAPALASPGSTARGGGRGGRGGGGGRGGRGGKKGGVGGPAPGAEATPAKGKSPRRGRGRGGASGAGAGRAPDAVKT